MRRAVLLLLVGGAAAASAAEPKAAEPAPAVALPPVSRRPLVVMDKLRDVGLLLPSAQQATAAVVVELNRRYGEDACVLEDELQNRLRMRRLAGKTFALPADTQKAEDERLALLKWALAEAPYRVTVHYKPDKGGYLASAECREKGSKTVIHRVEGRGKAYEAAVDDLKPRLKTFCGVLDAAATERGRRPAR